MQDHRIFEKNCNLFETKKVSVEKMNGKIKKDKISFWFSKRVNEFYRPFSLIHWISFIF